MMLGGLFTRRVRGVRLINLWGAGVLLILVVGLYLTKTFAGDEGADIARTETRISEEQRQIRLLQVELSYLERPRRVEALAARYLGMEPTAPKQEIKLADLQRVAGPPPAAAGPPTPSLPLQGGGGAVPTAENSSLPPSRGRDGVGGAAPGALR
jgi:cell division protein FtsL